MLTSFRGKPVRLWFMAACPTCVGQSEAQGFIIFLTYALEVGTMMTIISTLRGISNQKFARVYPKKLAHNINTITSVNLTLAGTYLFYYNIVICKLIMA